MNVSFKSDFFETLGLMAGIVSKFDLSRWVAALVKRSDQSIKGGKVKTCIQLVETFKFDLSSLS
jgi:hypothetical protein